MKFKASKLILGLLTGAMLFSGCELLNLGEEDKEETKQQQVQNTDESGNVNGDPNFNPEDVVSQDCQTLMQSENPDPVKLEACVDEYQQAFNPGNLSDACQDKYDWTFEAADMLVQNGCVDGGSQDPACEEFDMKLKNRTEAFYTECGGEVGDKFVFPWNADDHGGDHYCDPNTGECFEGPMMDQHCTDLHDKTFDDESVRQQFVDECWDQYMPVVPGHIVDQGVVVEGQCLASYEFIAASMGDIFAVYGEQCDNEACWSEQDKIWSDPQSDIYANCPQEVIDADKAGHDCGPDGMYCEDPNIHPNYDPNMDPNYDPMYDPNMPGDCGPNGEFCI